MRSEESNMLGDIGEGQLYGRDTWWHKCGGELRRFLGLFGGLRHSTEEDKLSHKPFFAWNVFGALEMFENLPKECGFVDIFDSSLILLEGKSLNMFAPP